MVAPVLTPTNVEEAFAIIREVAEAGRITPRLRKFQREMRCTEHVARMAIVRLVEQGRIIIHEPGSRARYYEIIETGARTLAEKDAYTRASDPQETGEEPAPHCPAQDGSAKLLKRIAAYHHSRGRPGWEALL